MFAILSSVVILTSFMQASTTTKVIELSDRFLELKGDSTWIVMFYAPWCGHCKKLEPIWNHVAQALYNTDIRVGRVDCTRFTVTASEFGIRGFPTVMYLQGDNYHIYKGERTTNEIVGFALRMASVPVPHLSLSDLQAKSKEGVVFFLFAGQREGKLWEVYYSQAIDFRHFHFFFSTNSTSLQEDKLPDSDPSVLVFKDDSLSTFPFNDEEDIVSLNDSLRYWINNERFPLFVKYTSGNFNQLSQVQKLLAIAVFQESRIGELDVDETMENPLNPYQFRDMIHSFIKAKMDKFHKHFQFGWTGVPDLVNSIAMEKLPIPGFVVINITTMHNYLPKEPSHQLNEERIETFLNSILNQTAEAHGGDSYYLRVYRAYFSAKTSLEDMWTGNPVLTALLFGLPMGFLSLICYSIWCADILDANEEEEKEIPHEKKE